MVQTTGPRLTPPVRPGRGSASKYVALVALRPAAFQKREILLPKRPRPVMPLLPGDVGSHHFALGRTDRECAVALLPGECLGTGPA